MGATRAVQSVLVADDDVALLTAATRSLGKDRRVLTATTAHEARLLAGREVPDLVIVDLRLGTYSGIDLIRQLRRDRPELVIVLYSAYMSVVAATAAMRAGADVVVFKPCTFHEILRRVEEDAHEDPDLDETPTLASIEWEHIARVVADCNGNITLAAKKLGLYRSSLQRRLRKHAPKPE